MAIRKQSIEILNQLTTVIEKLGNEEYSKPLSTLSDSSIGKHIRHIIEFYQCLFNGIPEGIVDYDKRERNLKLETDPVFTIAIIRTVISQISNTKDISLVLHTSYENQISELRSSVFRELFYNIEHATHHLAIIKIGITQHFSHITTDENLGVAYSTIQYREQVISE